MIHVAKSLKLCQVTIGLSIQNDFIDIFKNILKITLRGIDISPQKGAFWRWFSFSQSGRCFFPGGYTFWTLLSVVESKLNAWLSLVPVQGGRQHIISQLAVYTTYLLPSGGLYQLYPTYHLLREPETTIAKPFGTSPENRLRRNRSAVRCPCWHNAYGASRRSWWVHNEARLKPAVLGKHLEDRAPGLGYVVNIKIH